MEQQETPYDLNFQIFGFPVRVHPLFWLAAVILGSYGLSGFSGPESLLKLLIWTTILFVSILIHELGHAFVMRYFGKQPRILLYMMGGLAIHDSGAWGTGGFSQTSHNPKNHILICLAGPGAGFVLAALTLAIVQAAGGDVKFALSFPFFWSCQCPTGTNTYVNFAVHNLLWINILWGMVNLLPVYPLDGGQIARELFSIKDPWNGVRNSLMLSVATAAVMAGIGLLSRNFLIGIMFASLGYSSYMAIQQISGGGFGGGRSW